MTRSRCVLAAVALAFAFGVQAGELVLDPSVAALHWVDSDGQPYTLAQARGRPVVMSMAYTACRRFCTTTTMVMNELQKQFDAQHIDAEFVIVTYDPANDTPTEWTDYRKRRGYTRANWHFLAGSAADTRRIARTLDLDFWEYHGHVVHDFRILVLDKEGHIAREVRWDDVDDVRHWRFPLGLN